MVMLAGLRAACGMPAPRNPLKSKGAGAWDNAKAIYAYVDEKGLQEGSNCFFGFLHVFGDHKDNMPLSARALQAWSRLIQQAEGMPL